MLDVRSIVFFYLTPPPPTILKHLHIIYVSIFNSTWPYMVFLEIVIVLKSSFMALVISEVKIWA